MTRPITARGPIDLLLTLDRGADAAEGLTRQIYAQVRAAILAGRLRAGDRLPPSRELAASLGVARLTVATAYEWLHAEGYVYGRVGAGTYVAAVFEAAPARDAAITSSSPTTLTPMRTGDRETPGPPTEEETPPAPPAHVALSSWARRVASIPLLGAGIDVPDQAAYDFRPGAGAWPKVVGCLVWHVDPGAEQRNAGDPPCPGGERDVRGRRGRSLLLGRWARRLAVTRAHRRERGGRARGDRRIARWRGLEDGRDVGARADAAIHIALGVQPFIGRRHGQPRHAEAGRQLTAGRQPVASAQAPRQDRRAHLRIDLAR